MPKSITHLAKAGSKESLLHWHQHLPPVGKGREDTLRLGFAIQSQRQVSAPHRFGVWDVRRHHSVSPIEMRACRIALFHSGLTRLCSGDCRASSSCQLPSDHLPTGIMNTSIGSGASLNCGFSLTGDFARSAPHALPSRSVGYFCPVLTADGKLDCAPK